MIIHHSRALTYQSLSKHKTCHQRAFWLYTLLGLKDGKKSNYGN